MPKFVQFPLLSALFCAAFLKKRPILYSNDFQDDISGFTASFFGLAYKLHIRFQPTILRKESFE